MQNSKLKVGTLYVKDRPKRRPVSGQITAMMLIASDSPVFTARNAQYSAMIPPGTEPRHYPTVLAKMADKIADHNNFATVVFVD